MSTVIILLIAFWLEVISGLSPSTRIVGGSITTIDQYPFAAALLSANSEFESFTQACGGTILNTRAVLTAAHCFGYSSQVHQWRIRVGSTYANSGGIVHKVSRIINHPNYDEFKLNNDIAIVHAATTFTFNNNVQPGRIAGTNYNLADNQEVWAIGWGVTETGFASEQLRHVQVWTVNQDICKKRYVKGITSNMLCSGWLDVGGRDQCTQDSGGPLLHNNVVIGVCSFGSGCADPYYPGVNTRISRYTSWILENA